MDFGFKAMDEIAQWAIEHPDKVNDTLIEQYDAQWDRGVGFSKLNPRFRLAFQSADDKWVEFGSSMMKVSRIILNSERFLITMENCVGTNSLKLIDMLKSAMDAHTTKHSAKPDEAKIPMALYIGSNTRHLMLYADRFEVEIDPIAPGDCAFELLNMTVRVMGEIGRFEKAEYDNPKKVVLTYGDVIDRMGVEESTDNAHDE